MRSYCNNRNWKLLALISGVLVFTSYQFYWYLTIDSSLLMAMSIIISIVLIVALLKLRIMLNKDVIRYKENKGMNNNAFCEVSCSDSRVYCKEEVTAYLANIKGELEQAEQIINHAVINLVVNFKYISELSRSQQDIVLSVEKMAITTNNLDLVKLLRRQMMMIKRIDQELASTTISMQFGDAVVQLIQHTTKQINTLDSILQRIDQENIQRDNVHSADNNKLGTPNTVEDLKKDNLAKPTVQVDMQSGEIEIF